MADFKKAHLKTSKNEGGYVNNSADKGKETYRGIASAFFPKWGGWSIVHAAIKALGIDSTLDCPRSVRKQIDDTLAQSPELASMVDEFYKENFWDKLNLDQETSQIIAEEVFDTAVNMGVGTAKTMIEKARKNVA